MSEDKETNGLAKIIIIFLVAASIGNLIFIQDIFTVVITLGLALLLLFKPEITKY